MENEIYDVLILGGGPAGLTAGIYAGRAGLKAAIVEKQTPGGQAAITDEIANYPGISRTGGYELGERMAEQPRAFGAEYIQGEVTGLSLENQVKRVDLSDRVLKSRAVILATGATPKQLGFQGEAEFRGKGIGYCATCDGFFFRGKDIFVIGGGDSAAKEALYLTRFGKKVTILVRRDRFRCAQSLADEVMNHPKIEVLFNTEILRAYGDSVLRGAVFQNNRNGEQFEYKATEEDGAFGIFVFVGYQPSTRLFRGMILLDEEGYVITNERMEVMRPGAAADGKGSGDVLPGVYAAGDLRRKPLRQIITAAADGAVAAVQAEKYLTERKIR